MDPSDSTCQLEIAVSTCTKHENHLHRHHSACDHVAITHAGRTDYLRDGHLHHPHAEHVDGGILVRPLCLSSTLGQTADDDCF